MPQMLLPLFCDEMTPITPTLAYEKRDGEVYYFHGSEPVFHHREEDVASLRMIDAALGMYPRAIPEWKVPSLPLFPFLQQRSGGGGPPVN